MDLFSELVSTVQSDQTIGAESSLFPPDVVKLAVNRAYRKVGGLFRWPETEDAKKTSTEANQEYYDYPQNWRPESIWKIKVDGADYGDPLVFKDYLYEKEHNFPAGLQRMWASQWRRFFLYPTPSADGSFNICVWGQKIVDKLVNDNDVTIFSYSMTECNDAIVMEAQAILKNKGEDTNANAMLNGQALQIVTVAFGKVKQEMSKYQRTTGEWAMPDFFSSRSTGLRYKIGQF